MRDSKEDKRYQPGPREDYFADWHPKKEPETPDPRQMSEEERERYYAQRDAYYAQRDAYYARRDAYYASRGYDGGDEEEYDEYDEDADFEEEEYGAGGPARQTPKRKKRRKRKKHVVRRLVTLLLFFALGLLLWGAPPDARPGTARSTSRYNILLAGTDAEGYRTDTIMLLSVDRSDRTLRLLSIPRDTYTPDYAVPKINSAYGAGGMGELKRQTEKLLGFPPDAYVLVDLDCFVEAADILGGLDYDVPMDMRYDDPGQGLHIDLKAGYQHLNGEQVMGLVRFRSGYATADIGRTEVQRDFFREALRQWVTPENLRHIPELWTLYRQRVDTDLSVRNLLWLARMLLKADPSAMQSDLLPGWADMAGEYSVYMIERSAADQMMKEYDPWR